MARLLRPQTQFSHRASVRDLILRLNPRVRNYYGVRRAFYGFILQEVAERHWDAFNRKMNKRRDEFSRTWAPLRPATIVKKGHDLRGYETGHMRESFRPGYTTGTGRYIKGHADQIAEIGAFSFKFGSEAVERRKKQNRPKTAFFHYGRKGQKAREFWRKREVKRWVKAGIRKAIPKIAKMT